MAVSGVCLGVLQENSRKVPGKLLVKFCRIAKCTNSMISGTGKGKPAGNLGSTLPDLVPTFRAACFLKSTVPAFSSFSEIWETVNWVGLQNGGFPFFWKGPDRVADPFGTLPRRCCFFLDEKDKSASSGGWDGGGGRNGCSWGGPILHLFVEKMSYCPGFWPKIGAPQKTAVPTTITIPSH